MNTYSWKFQVTKVILDSCWIVNFYLFIYHVNISILELKTKFIFYHCTEIGLFVISKVKDVRYVENKNKMFTSTQLRTCMCQMEYLKMRAKGFNIKKLRDAIVRDNWFPCTCFTIYFRKDLNSEKHISVVGI